MTITAVELGFYVLGLLVLFLTPGPVWVALVARALAGGFRQAWPLTIGVAVGDVFWSVLAVMGMGWVTTAWSGTMEVLRWVAFGFFLYLGITILRHADAGLDRDSRLTRPGMWAGFLAGMVAILGNPKAVLFYMGVLPGFFDLSRMTGPDIVVIAIASFIVPLGGNLAVAGFVDRVRRVLASPEAVRRMNLVAGWLLIAIGLAIPLL